MYTFNFHFHAWFRWRFYIIDKNLQQRKIKLHAILEIKNKEMVIIKVAYD